MENTQRVWIIHVIIFSFNLTAERHLFLGAAKINRHIYFKGILSSKFEFKDRLLWKKGSAFVYTKGRNLWVPFRLISLMK